MCMKRKEFVYTREDIARVAGVSVDAVRMADGAFGDIGMMIGWVMSKRFGRGIEDAVLAVKPYTDIEERRMWYMVRDGKTRDMAEREIAAARELVGHEIGEDDIEVLGW